MRVVIVVHHERSEAAGLAQRLGRRLEAAGHEVVLPPDDAVAAGMADHASDDAITGAGLAVSLGGDGTMLRTVELAGRSGVPVLGVNVGLLGYLTEVEPEGADEAIDAVLDGRHRIEERMLLDVVASTDGVVRQALNEAVLEKVEAGHTIRLLPRINQIPFTPYAADGLIVATPTGSTAYALSARGPIVSPTLAALVMTPVSPHMLFDRTLVLDPSEVVAIEVLGHRPVALSIDGRKVATLTAGDEVTCRAAPTPARFVRFGSRDFHRILKRKFGLADR